MRAGRAALPGRQPLQPDSPGYGAVQVPRSRVSASGAAGRLYPGFGKYRWRQCCSRDFRRQCAGHHSRCLCLQRYGCLVFRSDRTHRRCASARFSLEVSAALVGDVAHLAWCEWAGYRDRCRKDAGCDTAQGAAIRKACCSSRCPTFFRAAARKQRTMDQATGKAGRLRFSAGGGVIS